MLQDLKAACRALLKARWFTCITVLTLALGIGANTAIYAVVNRLLLNPLPYPDADRLVAMQLTSPRVQFGYPTPNFVAKAWREQARSLDGLEAYSFRDVLAYDDNGARIMRGMRITPGLPALLSVAPLLGRGFTNDDSAAGAPAVVMLSYEAWQRDYAGAADVLGRAITVDDVAHVVVGVLPPRWDAFVGGIRLEVWFPLSLDEAASSAGQFQFIEVLARVRAGESTDAVKAELDTLAQAALASGPRIFGDDVSEIGTRVARPGQRAAESMRDTLLVLLGAVALVLLVACTNVANLLLARGASRARELALRSALGAGTWRLVRALFAECFVLAFVAGVVGVAFGWLTLRILVRLGAGSLPVLGDVHLDPAVLAFTFGLSIATALLFGVAPALQLTARKLGNALRHGASGVVRGGSGARVRKVLVAAQMAISVVLLVSAGLLVRSVIHLQQVDVGFDTDKLFSAQLALPRARYADLAGRAVLVDQLLERIRSSPGIASATHSFIAPPGLMMMGGPFEIRGVTLSEADATAARAFNYVRPDYFSMLGIGLLEGRSFTADELRDGGAMIVNRAAAEHFWPDGRALGAEVRWGGLWVTVVGVVDNIVAGGLTDSADALQYYLPFRPENAPRTSGGPPNVTLLARASDDPAVAIAALRAAVRELDPEIAIREVRLTDTALAATIDAPRFNMALLTAFAAIALVLAAVGLAGVIGYEVTERTHELGIRMALGARTESVRRLAMRHGLTPAAAGVVVGVLAALGATQLVTSMLHGVAPRDPATFVAVVVLLLLVAVGASWLPARRATRVDPIAALKAD